MGPSIHAPAAKGPRLPRRTRQSCCIGCKAVRGHISAGTMCGTASVVVVDMCRFGAPTHSAEAALALPQAFPVFRAKPVLVPQGVPSNLVPVCCDPFKFVSGYADLAPRLSTVAAPGECFQRLLDLTSSAGLHAFDFTSSSREKVVSAPCGLEPAVSRLRAW